jgi:hypothetical protein
MTGEERDGFHKMSFEIGRNSQAIEGLKELFAQHCEDDDRRHVENVALLKDNNDAIKTLSERLTPIAASHALTKRRVALVASLGFSLLVGLSWAIEEAVKWVIGWVLKTKFGG